MDYEVVTGKHLLKPLIHMPFLLLLDYEAHSAQLDIYGLVSYLTWHYTIISETCQNIKASHAQSR